jgi:hypothetical protein
MESIQRNARMNQVTRCAANARSGAEGRISYILLYNVIGGCRRVLAEAQMLYSGDATRCAARV